MSANHVTNGAAPGRKTRLMAELRTALAEVDRGDLWAWGGQSAWRFGTGTVRRSANLVSITARAGRFVATEAAPVLFGQVLADRSA